MRFRFNVEHICVMMGFVQFRRVAFNVRTLLLAVFLFVLTAGLIGCVPNLNESIPLYVKNSFVPQLRNNIFWDKNFINALIDVYDFIKRMATNN